MNMKQRKGNSSSFTGLVAKHYNASKKFMKRAKTATSSMFSQWDIHSCLLSLVPVSSLLPKHQRRGCHTHYSENAPSWCWRGRPECPGGTGQNYEDHVKEESPGKRKIPLLSVCPRESEHILTTCHAQEVQGALFTRARTWRNPIVHQQQSRWIYGGIFMQQNIPQQ